MKYETRRPALLERTAKALDLPVDAFAGLPKVELLGDGEVRVENHKGILAYGEQEIHISGGCMILKVAGEDLELRAMTGVELAITGRIRRIELE